MDHDPWGDLVAEEVGPIVFASSFSRELSREDDKLGHGIFTKALLDALASPATDVNGDGYLSITALDVHTVRRDKELSGGQQHAVTQKPLNVRDFNLARVRQAPSGR